MAEYAVNISSSSHNKPNFFEVIAQESLMNSIDPAVKIIFNVFTNQNPVKYAWIIKWYDELFLAVNSVIQYHYLKIYNASFSEAYYNLQRSLDIRSKNRRLTSKSLYLSLFFIVGLPYIRKKISSFITLYENKLFYQQYSANKKYMKLLIRITKMIGNAYEFIRILYLFRYLSGFSVHHSPLLRLAGVLLTYQNPELLAWHEHILSDNRKMSSKILPFTLKTLMTSFEVGAFCIHFLRWWHTDESRTKLSGLPIPKPPHKNRETTKCPLCHCDRKNEVVLLRSGYVFCFLCIKNYLDEFHICPVTRLPASSDDLVKIFSDYS